MVEINFSKIEKKWQNRWEKEGVFEVIEDSKKKKYYVLEMFPYPSGDGLHMGHALNYVIGDVLARFMKMRGFNVLHAMGYDALGLPAENAAIKDGTHPSDYTTRAISNYTKQMIGLGIGYDWKRTVNTADPSYYKWDQWIFLRMLKKGLAYRKEASVNWCPKCDTVLANEQVVDGKCWRHEEANVKTKSLKQWFFKITDYASELYDEIDNLDGWPERTKLMQKNWIGKSHGVEIIFNINRVKWPVFTTRPDTIFGVTFMVVSAKHSKLDSLVTKEQRGEVDKFLKGLESVSEKNFANMDKKGVFTGSYAINPANGEKIPVYAGNFVVADYGSGMVMAVPGHDQRDFEFAKKYKIEIRQVVAPSFYDSKNPPRKEAKDTQRNIIHAIVLNKEGEKFIALKNKTQPWLTPITGGIKEGETVIEAAVREIKEETGYQNFKLQREMPYKLHAKFYAAHKKINRSVFSNVLVFKLENETKAALSKEEDEKHEVRWLPLDKLNTLHPVSELDEIIKWFNKDHGAYTGEGQLINSGEFNGIDNQKAKVKITSWLSKKKLAKKVVNFKIRDWGVSRQRYWGTPIPIIYCDDCGAIAVPEKDLPIVLPKKVKFGKGNPLESAAEWINVKCPKCGGKGKRETDTLDTFVNSSWYFLRYTDAQNSKEIFDKKKAKYWCPVDFYIGGAEHACMHLIYFRFYTKFLRDIGYLNFGEPAEKIFHQGMLLGEGGVKMSKSKGNVINPEAVSKEYGIDTARFFLLSLASPDKDRDWNEQGIAGSLRFIKKLFYLFDSVKIGKSSSEVESILNKSIVGITNDIETLEYRAATIKLKSLFDKLVQEKEISKETLEKSLKLLNPICPHITEELWEKLGNKDLISISGWPKAIIKKASSKKEDLNSKIVSDIKYVLEKTKESPSKIYIYVMPFEIKSVDSKKLAKGVGFSVEVFSVADSKKYDPKGKAKKAKPGKASIYFETASGLITFPFDLLILTPPSPRSIPW